jgi:pyruvate formate lyase activating enzyme
VPPVNRKTCEKSRPSPGNPIFLTDTNYGKALQVCQEVVETDGIFHYRPGAPTLAIGTLGCTLHCDFCQNWQFSRLLGRYSGQMRTYSPEVIVNMASHRGINIISWTYNEPIVSFEFILETARLARERGIVCLLNSSFFISLEVLERLTEWIDVFAFSLKSIQPRYYQSVCHGWLEPVLEAARFLATSQKHVEYKVLVVDGENDDAGQLKNLVSWFVDNIGIDRPLHFVSARPAYKCAEGRHTDPAILASAREMAMSRGVKHTYVGNVLEHEGLNTYCENCGSSLLERIGVALVADHRTELGNCLACGQKPQIEGKGARPHPPAPSEGCVEHFYQWGDNLAIHLAATNETSEDLSIQYWHDRVDRNGRTWGNVRVDGNGEWRQMIPRLGPKDERLGIVYHPGVRIEVYEVKSRASYPLTSVLTLGRNVT